MITDVFITVLVGLFGGILAALPEYTLPPELTQDFPVDVATYVSWANGYFPVYHAGIALGVLLGVRLLMTAWTVVVWVYEKFPFKFT